jgi:hypothetical protein
MKSLTLLTALLLTSLVGLGQTKKDTRMFKIEHGTPPEIEWQLFTNESHICQLVVSIGNDMVCVNYKNGKLICDTPFTVVKHQHAIIIYKRDKKIGAFTYFKKPFELTDLHLN